MYFFGKGAGASIKGNNHGALTGSMREKPYEKRLGWQTKERRTLEDSRTNAIRSP